MRLCKYSGVFGQPNVGFHAPRIFGLAALDTIGTIVIIAMIIYFAKMSAGGAVVFTVASVLFVIFIHWLFCVDTALNRKLGLSKSKV